MSGPPPSHVMWRAAEAARWSRQSRAVVAAAVHASQTKPVDPLAQSARQGRNNILLNSMKIQHGTLVENVLKQMLSGLGWTIIDEPKGLFTADGPAGQKYLVACLRGWNVEVMPSSTEVTTLLAALPHHAGRIPIVMKFYGQPASQVVVGSISVWVVTASDQKALDNCFSAPGLSTAATTFIRHAENQVKRAMEAEDTGPMDFGITEFDEVENLPPESEIRFYPGGKIEVVRVP
jgi:hypothetical protein